jgi:hypothetical protein
MALRQDRRGMPKIETSLWLTSQSLLGEFKHNALLRIQLNRSDDGHVQDFRRIDRGPFQDLTLFISGWLLEAGGTRNKSQVRLNVCDSVVPAPGRRLQKFLDVVGFFIPKSVREPFWRDLVDDRDEMGKAGRSQWFIRCAIASQIVWLVLLNAKDLLVQIATGKPTTK